MRYFRRDLRSLACEILLPCIIVVVGLGLMTISFIVDPSPLVLSVDNFDWSPTRTAWAGDNSASDIFKLFDSNWKVDRI